MYILNGVGTILIEGKEYKMIAGEFIVVDSNQIHEARCARASMMIVIHFSRSAMIQIEPNLEKYRISCRRSELLKTNLEDYFQVCDLLKNCRLFMSISHLAIGWNGRRLRFRLCQSCYSLFPIQRLRLRYGKMTQDWRGFLRLPIILKNIIQNDCH